MIKEYFMAIIYDENDYPEFKGFEKGYYDSIYSDSKDIINTSDYKIKYKNICKNINNKKINKNKYPLSGKTNLLKQFDFCSRCRHCAMPRPGVIKDNNIFCANVNKYMEISELKECKIFCKYGL